MLVPVIQLTRKTLKRMLRRTLLIFWFEVEEFQKLMFQLKEMISQVLVHQEHQPRHSTTLQVDHFMVRAVPVETYQIFHLTNLGKLIDRLNMITISARNPIWIGLSSKNEWKKLRVWISTQAFTAIGQSKMLNQNLISLCKAIRFKVNSATHLSALITIG